jgi:hypothetical protein
MLISFENILLLNIISNKVITILKNKQYIFYPDNDFIGMADHNLRKEKTTKRKSNKYV